MVTIVKGLEAGCNSFRSERPFVHIQDVIVQDNIFFVVNEEIFALLKKLEDGNGKLVDCKAENFSAPMIQAFKMLLGDTVGVEYKKTGTWDGFGHGEESITVVNPDGSLVYQWSRVGHCEGPGYSCSYNHGPWYEYGTWTGKTTINEELKLREVVLLFLARQASFEDLKRAVE